MKSPGVKVAAILDLAAVIFLGAAVFETYQRYRDVLLWKSAQATVLEPTIAFRHDGEGRLRFFVRATLRYTTSSGEQTVVADSAFDSLEFAAARSRIENYRPGTTVKVHYDPAQPTKVRFGTEYSIDYLGRAMNFYIAFAGLMLAAAMAAFLWKGQRICAGCKRGLKYHYRYCTFCGAARAGI